MKRPAALGFAAVAVIATGIAVRAAVAGADMKRSEHTTVVLTIRNSRFTPPRVVAYAGVPIRFVVHNTDPIDHELIVGDAAVQERHEHGAALVHNAAGEITVAAGTTASTTTTFAAHGDSFFGCHLPGHWAYGMHGTVQVVRVGKPIRPFLRR